MASKARPSISSQDSASKTPAKSRSPASPPRTPTPARQLDMGSDAYLWRIKDQFLGARFADCYQGPSFYALSAGEQRRRIEMYAQRRSDEYWYLWRAWGRSVRWSVLAWLGCKPW